MNTKLSKLLPTLISATLTASIWFIIPAPIGVSDNAWKLFAIFVGTISSIIGKVLPIGAISIISITLIAATGITQQNEIKYAIDDALSGFSNQLIWLIGISMMISVSINKTGLGSRIGYYFVSLFGKKTIGIAYSLTIAETILAPITPSNTARGGAIIHPVVVSISKNLQSHPKDTSSKKIGKYLSLVNFNANPITSAMFITATAPNPLIVNIISESTNHNINISWGMWTIAGIIPGIISLITMPLIIYYLYPPEIKTTQSAQLIAKQKLKELGPLSKNEKITLSVFSLLLILWSGIINIIFKNNITINPTTSALIGLSILLVTKVLKWDDILETKNAWDTIIWFSSLVMIASFLKKLGLINWFSRNVEFFIKNLNINWAISSILLILIYLYSHYFFASTTAHIMAMFAAFLSAGLSLGANPFLFSMIMASASSLMMSLTHYSTGTAPIIFGSGFVKLSEWWKTGLIISISNTIIWIVIGSIWWKILGYW